MDVACVFQLYRREIWVRILVRVAKAPTIRTAFLDDRLRKHETVWSTKIKGRFTIVSREMAAN
jgi:hypothetical protein